MEKKGDAYNMFKISKELKIPIWELKEKLTIEDYESYVAFYSVEFDDMEKAHKEAQNKSRFSKGGSAKSVTTRGRK